MSGRLILAIVSTLLEEAAIAVVALVGLPQLGSDVPLFLAGPLSRVRGRGESVEPLGFDWPFWAVLLCPPYPLATAEVYRKFDQLLTKAPQAATIMNCQLGSNQRTLKMNHKIHYMER